MPVDGEGAARLLLARLAQCKTSPTVLFWLKLRPKILEETELGSALLRLCDELCVVRSPNSDFFRFVKTESEKEKLAPVSPSFFVVFPKKKLAIENFRMELYKRKIIEGGSDPFMFMGALMPFCFQCLCQKTDDTIYAPRALFFIYANPEDGMRMMLKVFRERKYTLEDGTVYRFTQIYEHRLGSSFKFTPGPKIPNPVQERMDNRLACILLDWEVEEEKLEGRLSREEIRALSEQFPTWFYKQLHDKHLVDSKSYITGASFSSIYSHFFRIN